MREVRKRIMALSGMLAAVVQDGFKFPAGVGPR